MGKRCIHRRVHAHVAAALAVTIGLYVAPLASASELAERYGRLPTIADADLSADGSQLLTLVALQGAYQVGLRDLNTGEARILLSTDGDEFRYQWCRFANPTRVLCSLRKQSTIVAGNGSPYLGYTDNKVIREHLVAVDVDGGNVEQLVPKARSRPGGRIVWNAIDQDEVIAWLPAEPDVVLIQLAREDQKWPSVYRLDIRRNRLDKVRGFVTGLSSWLASNDGELRAGFGSVDGDFAAWLIADDQVRRVAIDALGIDGIPGRVHADPGDSRLRLIAHAGGEYAEFMEYVPGEARLEAVDLGLETHAITNLLTSPDDARLVGVAYEDAGPRARWFDPVVSAAQERIESAFTAPSARVQLIDWDQSKRRFVFKTESADQPPAYYLHDAPGTTQAGSIRTLAPQYPDVRTVHPSRHLRYRARDGLELTAWLTTPGTGDGPWPVVLLPHGGPAAHDNGGFDYWAQFVAARGAAVLQPNFRGSTGHGISVLKAGDGAWGREMQDDLFDGLDALVDAGVADSNRVCVLGGSYGGYAALVAAYRDASRVRCAIAFAGVSDLDQLANYWRRWLYGRSAAARLPPRGARAPASPVENVARFAVPLLVVHGAEDRVVKVGHSRQLVDALRAQGKDVRYLEQPQGDHGLSRQADRIEFFTEVDAFLTRHLALE